MNKRQRKKRAKRLATQGDLVDFICSISPFDIPGFISTKEETDERYERIIAALTGRPAAS